MVLGLIREKTGEFFCGVTVSVRVSRVSSGRSGLLVPQRETAFRQTFGPQAAP